jgi:hypothetical protein
MPGRRVLRRGYGAALCASVAAAMLGCGVAPAQAGGRGDERDEVASAASALLSTACSYDAAGNLTLKAKDAEVAYVGLRPGCTVEPCVIANAVDSWGSACKVASTGKTITITGEGVAGKRERVVLDYTNGLFALATGATAPVSISLDTTPGALSELVVIAPKTGGNVAVGAAGLDLDARALRSGGVRLDVKLAWSTSAAPGGLTFQGGAGADTFTGDTPGWATTPAGWDTSANVSRVVGSAFLGAVTADGGDGDDILAGGAGASTLLGGAGNDTFRQSTVVRTEIMSGGDGIDTVDYGARAANLSVTLDGTANDGAAGELDDVGRDIEIVKGGAGNDTLDASGLSVTDAVLLGGAGNDTLIGGPGADDLCGGSGADILKWSGADTGAGDNLVGGAGSDTADYSGASAGVVVCLDASDATCFPASGPHTNGPGTQLDTINDARLGAVCPRATLTIDFGGTPTLVALPVGMLGPAMTNDVENVTGHASLANVLHCGTLACTAVGGAGDDTIVGSPQIDQLFSGGSATGDDISTGGGSGDLVDLRHTGPAILAPGEVVSCGAPGNTNVVTILNATGDALSLTDCAGATVVH